MHGPVRTPVGEESEVARRFDVVRVLLVSVIGIGAALATCVLFLDAPRVVDVLAVAIVPVLGILAWRLSRARFSTRMALRAVRSRERRLAVVTDTITDVVFISDRDGAMMFISPSITRSFGITAEEFVRKPIEERIHPEDRDRFFQARDYLRARPGLEVRGEYRIEFVEGTHSWVEARGTNLLEHPDVGGVVTSVRDITERQAALDALVHSEQRFRSLADSSPVGVYRLGREGAIEYVNQRTLEMLGLPAELLLTMTPDDIVAGAWAPDNPDLVERMVAVYQTILEGSDESIDVEYEMPDGATRWLAFRVKHLTDLDGEATGVVGTIEDITDRLLASQRLQHQATHDALTGLPNRRLLLETLGAAMERADREGRLLAVLFCDLDLFKVVNDSLGHDVGDQLLPAIAQRFARVLRPGDTLARFGGDEFVVICDGLSTAEAAELVGHQLVETLRDPIAVGDHRIRVATSVGVAVRRLDHDRPDALIRDADLAMYRAKERGRSRVAVFDDSMRAKALRRMDVEQSLRAAAGRGELSLAYQPIVLVDSGELVAMEALLRWHSPVHGALSPEEFIPIAEEIGLVVELDEWVLGRACDDLARWRGSFPVAERILMSVNLSGRHLARPDLVAVVQRSLATSGLPPSALGLEITETAVMAEADVSERVLDELTRLGVRLAVDDFGTGYSSLAYLRRFPVDVLKVDQEFVGGLGRDAGDSQIVQAVITLGRTLGLLVVAEGVETPQQLAALRELGCDMAQGYLFARPMPAEAVETYLAGIPAAVDEPEPAKARRPRPQPPSMS